MTGTPAIRVVPIAAACTHDLRREVLRGGSPTATVVFDGDDDPETIHLGAWLGEDLVGVSTWMRRPFPGIGPMRVSEAHVQLRGMATALGHQGRGVGGALLHDGLARCRRQGVGLVWARARSRALAFYERHGFTTVGERFVDDTTGLAHHLVRLEP